MSQILRRNISLKHFVFWGVLTLYLWVFDSINYELTKKIIGMFLIIVRYPLIYYTQYSIIFPKFYKKRIKLLGLLFFVFTIYYIASFFIFNVYLEQWVEGVPPNVKFQLLINSVVVFSIISVMALGAYQKKVAIQNLLKQNEREKTLLFRELGFLKNQFNSQATFNFLNHCYDQIVNSSKETAEAIKIFSRMLQYSLNNSADNKTSLITEVEYMGDFIELQKLLNEDVNAQFKVTGKINDEVRILPRILIVFVENAFKHGNISSENVPIEIQLEYLEGSLIFRVRNEKAKNKIIEPSGIGHFNMKEQLEMFYKGKYSLTIDQNESIYSSTLNLSLNG